MMKISDQGLAFIVKHEGFVPRGYLDPAEILTIGYGFTWRSDSFRSWWSMNRPAEKFTINSRISREDANGALRYLIEREYGAQVRSFLGKKVEQHVFDAMVSVVYNCGARSLNWKWAAAAKAGDYKTAARHLRSTAVTAGGQRLRGLVRRRAQEAALLAEGTYHGSKAGGSGPQETIIRRGSSGNLVDRVMSDLKRLGHYDGRIDGIFGPGMEAAVLEFQKRHGLKPDGIVGPKTRAAITRETDRLDVIEQANAPVPEPKPKPKQKPADGSSQNLIGLIFAAVLGAAAIALAAMGYK